MLTSGQLFKQAKQYAKEFWNLELDIPIYVNSRLTRLLGRFVYNKYDKHETRIELSKDLVDNFNDEDVLDVLRHELTHWALHKQGKPCKDGHPVFENELKRVGAKSTHSFRRVGEMHKAICSKCGKVAVKAPKQSRLNRYIKPDSRYATRCCGAKLVYGGTEWVDPSNAVVQKNQKSTQEPATSGSFTIEDIVERGNRGVTNAQMIPAIKKAIDECSKEKLEMLRNHYPDIFQSSVKYLGHKHSKRLYEIIPLRIYA